jgi:CNT family concentrative nucleoside transporter
MTGSARALRLWALAVMVGVPGLAWLLSGTIGYRTQAAAGAVGLLALVAACSPDLRRVSWRTVFWGMGLQAAIALAILRLEIGGVRPAFQALSVVANGVRGFLDLTNAGSQLVFGVLADPARMGDVFGPAYGVVFAFTALPTIIFVSAFFSVLYHLKVLPVAVRWMARAMASVMRTSGAETLSAVANVFMGMTEAPLVVRPFVAGMTRSELLTLMVGGLSTVAGGVMAVYIGLGADPVAVLTTSVMAAPAGLYLAKILLPEHETPATLGDTPPTSGEPHANAVDALAAGATTGLHLALNVGAMLIAFLAFLALFDYVLGAMWPGLTLARIFAVAFSPLAFMVGVPAADVGPLADLLGTKLVANEFVAFIKLTTEYQGVISDRTFVLATYALTGFANVGSLGVLLGGLGGIAPERRGDMARLTGRALLGGFVATLLNACIASMLL